LQNLVASTEKSAEAFLEFARAESAEILVAHKTAVLAIANALVEQGTLDAEQSDSCIAVAEAQDALEAERGRRLNWCGLTARAAAFKASLCISDEGKNAVTN
jgi:hypothetical protein